jgi:hypothetical protein
MGKDPSVNAEARNRFHRGKGQGGKAMPLRSRPAALCTPYVLDSFSERNLSPATADEIATTLSFALRYDGKRRVFDADDAMARITAARLVKHLEMSGFVVMKRPPAAAPRVGTDG